MKTITCVVLWAVALSAQDVSAPAIDDATVKLMQGQILLADQVVGARLETLKLAAPKPYEAYAAAVQQRDSLRASIEKQIKEKAPGYALDVQAGKLVPQQAKK